MCAWERWKLQTPGEGDDVVVERCLAPVRVVAVAVNVRGPGPGIHLALSGEDELCRCGLPVDDMRLVLPAFQPLQALDNRHELHDLVVQGLQLKLQNVRTPEVRTVQHGLEPRILKGQRLLALPIPPAES